MEKCSYIDLVAALKNKTLDLKGELLKLKQHILLHPGCYDVDFDFIAGHADDRVPVSIFYQCASNKKGIRKLSEKKLGSSVNAYANTISNSGVIQTDDGQLRFPHSTSGNQKLFDVINEEAFMRICNEIKSSILLQQLNRRFNIYSGASTLIYNKLSDISLSNGQYSIEHPDFGQHYTVCYHLGTSHLDITCIYPTSLADIIKKLDEKVVDVNGLPGEVRSLVSGLTKDFNFDHVYGQELGRLDKLIIAETSDEFVLKKSLLPKKKY